MCEVSTVLLVGGALFSMGKAVVDGIGAANAGAAAEEQAMNNKKIAEEAAGDARLRGNIEAGQVLAETAQVVGEQKTQYAEGGVVVGSGTAADVQAATSAEGRLRALTVQNNAIREAWGFKNQAEEFSLQAKQIGAETSARVAGSVLSTGGAAVQGFANVYNSGREFGLWKKR